MDTKYNGWTNYATWNINLWLTNDEWTDSMMREWAQECYDEAEKSQHFSRKEEAIFVLRDRIKDFVEEENPIKGASMYSDLLGAAISSADFHEIAESFMESVEEEDEEENDEE